MNPPLLSIIIPCYNAEKTIEKCITSILNQSFENWELILVDDGSVDNTSSIAKILMGFDNRVSYYYQKNSGPSIARNNGIKYSKGIYLNFIDADDWVSTDYLEKLVEPLLRTETDLVCAGYYEVNPKFPKGIKLHDFKEEKHNQIITKIAFQTNLFNGVGGVLWSKLFKKEIFVKNNIQLHPALRFSEDLVAVLEYSRYIKNVYILPDHIYFYNRVHDSGLSGSLNIEKYGNLEMLFNELDKFKIELYFLDLTAIKNKKRYSFIMQLLHNNVSSRQKFYEVAEFLVQSKTDLPTTLSGQNRFYDFILNEIGKGKYFQAWMLLRCYQLLSRIKNA